MQAAQSTGGFGLTSRLARRQSGAGGGRAGVRRLCSHEPVPVGGTTCPETPEVELKG